MTVQNNYYKSNLSLFRFLDFNLKILLVITYLVLIDNYKSALSIIILLVITSLLVGLKFSYVIDTDKSYFNKSILFFTICIRNKSYTQTPFCEFKMSHLQGLGPKIGGMHNRNFMKIQLFKESSKEIIFIAHEKNTKELKLLHNSLKNTN